MACPKFVFDNRELIILLDLAKREEAGRTYWLSCDDVPAVERLKRAATIHPDAVAFGFARGNWFAAA